MGIGRLLLSLILAAGVTACGDAAGVPGDNMRSDRPDAASDAASNVSMPKGAVILSGKAGLELLDQCSRDVPPPGEGEWTPSAGDILALEKALVPELRRYESSLTREQQMAALEHSDTSVNAEDAASADAKAKAESARLNALSSAELAQEGAARQRAHWAAFQNLTDAERRESGFAMGDLKFSDIPAAYHRQYMGFVRDGRRFIYGNFAPRELEPSASNQPIIVCDGGPQFFGVEYEPATRRFTLVSFNGGG